MNRSIYFDYIERELSNLSSRIERRSKLNLLEINVHAEMFYAELLNLIFGYNFINLNTINQNVASIDLIDFDNKVTAQVSSTCSKRKIQNSLEKDILKKYKGYTFIFIALVGDANPLRINEYSNPHQMRFDSQSHIHDMTSILRNISGLQSEKLRSVYSLIKGELGSEMDMIKIESNLAGIINILAKEDLRIDINDERLTVFDIAKKIEYNDLEDVRRTINDFKIYHNRLDAKYVEYNRLGSNKSMSVLYKLNKIYDKLKADEKDSTEIFSLIIDEVIELVQQSSNYHSIPFEELEMCVSIVVVDAFMRCRIFESPEGYHNAIT